MKIGTEETSLALNLSLLTCKKLISLIGWLSHIINFGKCHVALTDATIATLPYRSEFGSTATSIIVTDIKRGTSTTSRNCALSQVSSSIKPRVVDTQGTVKQEIICIPVELLCIFPSAECFLLSQLVTRLLVEEVTA